MTSQERMMAALEGRPVDYIPVAPYFWGAEYSWKLVGKPIWEVLHGEGDMCLAILEAIDRRHGCDWVIPLHQSSGQLAGKSFVREDDLRVYFIDDQSGEEYIFHKEGHWLCKTSDIEQMRIDNEGANIDPPTTKAEADDWLRRYYPHIDSEPGEHVPNSLLKDRFQDRFVCASTYAPFASIAYPMGFEPTMLLLHDNPHLCAYIIERILTHLPHHCKAIAADGYDGAMMVDSFASADIMSPETYTNWIAPIHKMVSDELHKVGLKSIMYNTGNILPLLPSIGKMGFDAITFEERIKGLEMDIGDVRRAVGPEQCLFANFDAYLLLKGDRDAVRSEVYRQIDAAGPSAFVMGTGSPICDATDPDIIDYWISETQTGLELSV
ncbi:MAG: uroporphyrinogen decarboxylase family protein [Armatimonadota bacterium]